MIPLCTLLKSGSDVLIQTFTVLVYTPSFLGYIRELENVGTALTESFAVVQKVKDSLETVPASQGKIVAANFKLVIENNPGYKDVFQIADIFSGKCETVTKIRNSYAYKTFGIVNNGRMGRSHLSHRTFGTVTETNFFSFHADLELPVLTSVVHYRRYVRSKFVECGEVRYSPMFALQKPQTDEPPADLTPTCRSKGGRSSNQNEGDNASEMSPGSNIESYPAFARIGLRENPGKNLNQITCPDRDSNPGQLVSQPDALTVTPKINGISDSEMVFGEVRPKIRQRLSDNRLTFGKTSEKLNQVINPKGNRTDARAQLRIGMQYHKGDRYIYIILHDF
ncbi:hypothetical protein ANN_19696 [Periplaneta americana]|uniref:Uncharacterized protein n=1 Tax=Periplaneta americana TaxID=6978 RepID=A0ABQ8SB92_PERAM|nr:hypothetical protein ANN_19696 [Periplaneta americana]